jgi:hypothetical protein
MLSFLYPAFLFGVAAISIPIILHLLKREAAPPLSFSAVRFLKRAPVEHSRRKRLRELLLLALRVVALLLLALAFARPYFSMGPHAASAPVTVVAIDTSFSLSAPGQFDRARDLARRAIKAAPADHLVALVSFDDVARALVEPTGNRGIALAAIDELAVGHGATRFGPALARAADLIGARTGRVVVVSDLQRSGWDTQDAEPIPARIVVEPVLVASPDGNLAVGAIRRQGSQTIVAVLHGGRVAPTARVTLDVDGRRVADEVVKPGEGASTDVVFGVPLPERGVASASVDDASGYEGDNTRFLLLDPPAPAPLLVVGETGRPASDAFYLQQALSVADEPYRFALTGVGTEAAKDLTAETLRPYGAVLLLSTRRFDRRGWEALAGYLTAGGGVLVPADGQVDGVVVREILGRDAKIVIEPPGPESAPLSFAPVDLRHPIFRPFGVFAGNLGQVRFLRVRRMSVEPGDAAQIIARFSDASPALVEHRIGSGRMLIFASDLNNRWNDFPLHPGFVPFVHEAVRYLARSREQRADVVVADVPPGVAPAPGVMDAGQGRRIAVNVDLREAGMARMAADEFQARVPRIEGSDTSGSPSDAQLVENEQSYWRYGLMLMLLALAAEGLLGTRTGA